MPWTCTARTKYRKFKTNIHRKGIVQPQSQLPRSCVCERFIYSHDLSANILLQENMWSDPGIYNFRMRSSLFRNRFSLVVRASDCQCTSRNGPGFDPSIRRHSGIWGAADEAVSNIVKKIKKSPPQKKIKKSHTDTWMWCGNWDWGRAIPFLGIHKWDFRCSVALLFTILEPKEPFSWSSVS